MNQSAPSPSLPDNPHVIRLRIRDLRQLFNSMDPSPFHERDLDPGAADFIIGWVQDLPSDRRDLLLVVHVENPPASPVASSPSSDSAPHVADAVHNYFSRETDRARRELRSLLARGRTSFVIGLLFLAVCLGAADLLARFAPHDHPFVVIIVTSLTIVGWVALWRPLEIFLYDWWPILSRRRMLSRIARMDIRIESPTQVVSKWIQSRPPT